MTKNGKARPGFAPASPKVTETAALCPPESPMKDLCIETPPDAAGDSPDQEPPAMELRNV